MDEKNENAKLVFCKSMRMQSFNSSTNINIDTNVNFQQILSVDNYVYDEKFETTQGKVQYSGKIGTKLTYLDTDGLSNNITESTPFTETFMDESLTADCQVYANNRTISNSVVQSENQLKINSIVGLEPIVYINVPTPSTPSNFENMQILRSEISSYSIHKNINTNFSTGIVLETKDKINKVVTTNAYFTLDKLTPNENYAVVEGKLFVIAIYETVENDKTSYKEVKECNVIKTDLQLDGIINQSFLDLHFFIDQNKTNLSVEFENETSNISIDFKIDVRGLAFTPLNMEIVDDLYSTENQVELTTSSRQIISACSSFNANNTVSNEITLNDNEPAIEELISNLDISIETTNHYIKDDSLCFEGVISSQIIYLDENKKIKNRKCEIPFLFDTKKQINENSSYNYDLSIFDLHTRTKRGTIIELEYSIMANIISYEKSTITSITNVTIGKPINLKIYDYQIYIGKTGENLWQLSKRAMTTMDSILQINKNLPDTFTGGEKIIVKRC